MQQLTEAGALMSSCGTYRYRLWRYWHTEREPLIFIMLNPSTADGMHDDPTIRKCVGFAKRLSFGGIEVVNLFAYRATDPRDLRLAGYPAGPDNDRHIAAVLDSHGGKFDFDNVVCAWGAQGRGAAAASRVATVLGMVRNTGTRPKALAFTNDGTPSHPLMLPYSARPLYIDAGVAA